MREDQFKPFSECESVSLEHIKARCLAPDKTTFTCMADRPGIMGWMTQVEYVYFKPDTDANDDFWLITMNWPEDAPMLWIVITVPTSFEERCVALLWQHGLKALRHQLAMVFGPKGTEEFPLQGEHVLMLANVGQSVIYKNDQAALEKAREQEKEIALKYQEEHVKWLHTVEGRAIARAYWKKHGFDEKNLYPGVDLPPEEGGQKRF